MLGKRMVIVGVAMAFGFAASQLARAADAPKDAPAAEKKADSTAAPTSQPADAGSTPTLEKVESATETKETKAAEPVKAWLSFGTTLVHTSGNDQNFKQYKEMDDNAMYGVRSFGYQTKVNGTEVSIKGRAVVPYDYGVEVNVRNKKIGYVNAYYNQFPSYWNTAAYSYNFPPNVYNLNKDVEETRTQAGGKAGIVLPHGPTLEVYMDHLGIEGTRSPYYGGSVTNGTNTYYYYPLYSDIDEYRNTLGVDLQGSMDRFKTKVGVEVQDFNGSLFTAVPTFNSSGAVTSTGWWMPRYDWTELTPYAEINGDIIEHVLRLESTARYAYTANDNTYNEVTRNAAGTGYSGTSNNMGDEHNGYLHDAVINNRLVYTPNDRTMLYGAFGYKYEDSDSVATEKRFGSSVPNVLNTLTRINGIHTNEDQQTWMTGFGGSYQICEWLTAAADSSWEFSDVTLAQDTRREAGAGGDTSFRYRESGDNNKYEYGASLTAKPTRDLKFVGGWKQKIYDYGVDVTKDLINGAPNTTDYPGFLDDHSRETNEFYLMTQYRPNKYWTASHKVAGTLTEFEDDKLGGDMATQNDVSNTMSLTFSPVDEVSITGSGGVETYRVRARDAEKATVAGGRVPSYDGDMCFWGLDVTYDPVKKLALSAGVTRQNAVGYFPYQATEVYTGVTYRISKIWSADFKYGYVLFDEHGNGDVNNFEGNIFSFGLTANFD